MASVSDILNSPDYINANAATKEAIFNKHIASMPEFANANSATQSAIRQRFGLGSAGGDGMPTPRVTNYGLSEKTLAVPQEKGQPLFTYSPSEALKAVGRGAAKGVLTLGGLGDITGGAIGATSPEVSQALGFKETPPEYAPFEMIGGAVGPAAVSKIAGGIANVTPKVINAGERLVNPDLNALLQATNGKAPEIANMLRASTSGVETAGQAAAPARSAGFSQFTKELGAHAPDTVDQAQMLQDALLKARANIAEGKSSAAARTLADTVAEPDAQAVGSRLIEAADKEKAAIKRDVIRPAFKKAEDLAGDTPIDIGNVAAKAAEISDTIDPDAAAVLARRLGKFQGETKTAQGIGPGGAAYKFETGTTPPTATLSEVSDVRSAINNAAAKAKAAGDEDGYRRLMQLHNEVDKAITSSETLSEDAINAYKAALSAYATQYAPRFKTGLQVNLFKIRNGENAITPSNVIDKFFNNADTTDNFVALFGKNPAAMKDARLGMEGLFRDQVIKDGVVDAKAYQRFLKDYGPQIDKLDAAGLNLRNKFDTLTNETARVTAPEAAISEVRGAVKGGEPAAGAAKSAIDARVSALVDKTPPEDLASLRDAVEVARRSEDYNALARTPNAESIGVPVVPSKAPSFLNTKLRVITEVFRRVAGRLDTKMSKELGAMLHDPTRLNEAADLLDKAIAMQQRQSARVANPVSVSSEVGLPAAAINALAPPQQNRNALAPQ